MIVWNDFRSDARVLREAKTLAAEGHQVFVHALHAPGITPPRETVADRVEVIRVPRNALAPGARSRPVAHVVGPPSRGSFHRVIFASRLSIRMLSRSISHLRLLASMIRHRPDVVHAHDVNTLPTGFLAAKLAGAELVYDAHEISTAREGYEGLKPFVACTERTLIPHAWATITTTDMRARYLERCYGNQRPVVLQNRPVAIKPIESNIIRQRLGLTSGRPIVVYQGVLQRGRGLELLVRAACHVPGADFVLIGGGALEDSLKEISVREDLSERVHFVPTVPLAELSSYTASADIGVQILQNTCFNHYSTDSNKLFEYVQAGLAVVASDLPEIRNIVAGYDLGLLVPPGDLDAIVAALRQLVSNESLRDRLRNNARSAAPYLTWDSQEEKLLAMYRDIESRSGRVRSTRD